MDGLIVKMYLNLNGNETRIGVNITDEMLRDIGFGYNNFSVEPVLERLRIALISLHRTHMLNRGETTQNEHPEYLY